jgi:hypothetical protein
MPLSANTLIHFTKDKASLKGILEENFRIFLCKETITLEDRTTSFLAPMVSFCDIPLSEIKDHLSKYGHYGIGMTKEWGVKNGLNPVLYFSPPSEIAKNVRKAYNHFSGAKGGAAGWSEEQKALADIFRYIKNYEGTLVRKTETRVRYRFSDEREWRYVPPINKVPSLFVHEKYFEDKAAKEKMENSLEALRLEFCPNDIKYIIINEDSEIAEFIEHLRKVKGKTYSHQDVERLTTRILTAEQILHDM